MKNLVLTLTMLLSGPLMAAGVSGQSADAELARYGKSVNPEVLQEIPDSVKCGGDSLLLRNALDLDNFVHIWISDDGTSLAFIIRLDGDNERGYFVSKTDLINLKAKKVSQINADSFSGYWWIGDYGTYGQPVTCRLDLN